jgi:tape measure domain-containing protein
VPDIDDVGLRLRVEDDATAPLQRVRESAQQATTALKDIGSAAPELATITTLLREMGVIAERSAVSLEQMSARSLTATAAATDDLSNKLDGLDTRLKRVSGSMLDFFGTATKYGAAAFAGLTAAAGYFGVTASASFDQTRVAFSTMLGSVQAGNDLFKQLQQFNLQTPFGLPDLTRAEQTLLQYGLGNQSVPVLKTLANVAAVGTDPTNDLYRSALALGQISNSGVIRGQDLNQLTQAGFPVMRLLQQTTGLSGAQIQQQLQGGGIQLPASTLVSAIAGGGGSVLTPYADAARQQSLTLRGQASNFRDTLRSDLADASSPLSAQLLQTLPVLTEATHQLLTVAGPPVFAFLGDLLHGFTALIPVLQPILTGLSTGLHEFLSSLGPGAKDLIPVGQQLGDAFHQLFTDLAGHGPELSHLLVDLTLILPDMIHLLDDLIPLVDLFVKAVDGIMQFGPARDLAAGLLVTLLGYKALSGVAGIIGDIAKATKALAVAEVEEAEASTLGGGKTGKGGKGSGLLGLLGLGIAGDALAQNTSGMSRGGLLENWGQAAAGGAIAGASRGGLVGAAWGGALGLLSATGKSFYDQYTDDGSHGAPHSQIWDPTRPGYGGYPGTQDNRLQVNIENLNATSDTDIERALDNWNAMQKRRS